MHIHRCVVIYLSLFVIFSTALDLNELFFGIQVKSSKTTKLTSAKEGQRNAVLKFYFRGKKYAQGPATGLLDPNSLYVNFEIFTANGEGLLHSGWAWESLLYIYVCACPLDQLYSPPLLPNACMYVCYVHVRCVCAHVMCWVQPHLVACAPRRGRVHRPPSR